MYCLDRCRLEAWIIRHVRVRVELKPTLEGRHEKAERSQETPERAESCHASGEAGLEDHRADRGEAPAGAAPSA